MIDSCFSFPRYLKETGFRTHRCALLFGRISPTTKAIKVEAIYEPPQRTVDSSGDGDADNGSYYDSSALTEAAMAITSESSASRGGGGDEAGHGPRLSEAAAEVVRAIRVAELLGLRLVGWCLSHDKVGHELYKQRCLDKTAHVAPSK